MCSDRHWGVRSGRGETPSSTLPGGPGVDGPVDWGRKDLVPQTSSRLSVSGPRPSGSRRRDLVRLNVRGVPWTQWVTLQTMRPFTVCNCVIVGKDPGTPKSRAVTSVRDVVSGCQTVRGWCNRYRNTRIAYEGHWSPWWARLVPYRQGSFVLFLSNT